MTKALQTTCCGSFLSQHLGCYPISNQSSIRADPSLFGLVPSQCESNRVCIFKSSRYKSIRNYSIQADPCLIITSLASIRYELFVLNMPQQQLRFYLSKIPTYISHFISHFLLSRSENSYLRSGNSSKNSIGKGDCR